MKKQVKKLKLAKETVRNLSLVRGHVAGGAFSYTCICTFTCQVSCDVCESRNGAICPGTLDYCSGTCP
jgi:hypothetical protein